MVSKIALFLVLSLAYWTLGNAQSIKVLYQEETKLPKDLLKQLSDSEIEQLEKSIKPETYVLIYSKGKSVYFPCERFDFDNIEKTDFSYPHLSSNADKIGISKDIIYINFEANNFREELTFLSIDYSIKDSLKKINWTIYRETKEIAGYICHKAMAHLNGKKVTAYFTRDIHVKGGPNLYCGLPGLIMQIITDKKIYSAKEIQFIELIDIREPKNKTETITYASFLNKAYASKCIKCEEKNKK